MIIATDPGSWASFLTGMVLLFMSALGLRGFIGRALYSPDPASRQLARAIVLGFVAMGANTFYWLILRHIWITNEWATQSEFRAVGLWLDIVLKGGGATAIYLHLDAWRKSLPEDERRRWTVLGMAFYPRGSGYLARVLNGFCNGDKK